jgi:hypothetical protein
VKWPPPTLILALVLIGHCHGASLTGLPGIAGLKLGTVPEPGYYLSETFFSYSSDNFQDRHGNRAEVFNGQPVKFKVSLDAAFTTFQWVTPHKILEANYAMSVTGGAGKAVGDLDLGEVFSAGGEKVGLIDLTLQPINLSWHFTRFDFSTAYSLVAPTGTFDKQDVVNTGRDRWNHVFNAGMTAYFDKSKSWSLALAPRYDIHMGQQHKDAHDGSDFALGWGIGRQWVFKNCEKTAPSGIFSAGPVGYALFQTTYNTGSAAIQKDVLPKVFSAGLEARYTRLNWKGATFDIRVVKEFEARGRPQGTATTFSVGIKF